MGTGLYNGFGPMTVLLSLTSSCCGEHRVHKMTESGYGSPEATPWVKFSALPSYALAGLTLRLLT